MVEMNCPHCGHLLRIDDRYRGQTGQCRNCKGTITVPPDPVSEDSFAPMDPKALESVEIDATWTPDPELYGEAQGTKPWHLSWNTNVPWPVLALFLIGVVIVPIFLGLTIGSTRSTGKQKSTTGRNPSAYRPSERASTNPVDFSKWIDPNELEVGESYRSPEAVALMPEFEPADPITASALMVKLTPYQSFRIDERRMKRTTPWYHVTVLMGGQYRDGWINAGALYGDALERVPSEVQTQPSLQTQRPRPRTDTPMPRPATKPTTAATTSPEKVFITDTGNKYHREGCQFLRKSKRAISLNEAKANGYEPCSKCRPSR